MPQSTPNTTKLQSYTHIISETNFPAAVLIVARHAAFSANHVADIDKTKHHYKNNNTTTMWGSY